MTLDNDNENPFAYNREATRTDGARVNDTFHEYGNPFASFHTEPTSVVAEQKAGYGDQEASGSGRLIRLQRWNTGLRVATLSFTLLAVLVMFLSKQTADVQVQGDHGSQSTITVSASARYKYNGAFVFFVYMNLVVCAYALVLCLLALVMRRKGTGEATPARLMWMFFVLNLIHVTMLLLAFAAALSVEVVARNGMTLTGNDDYVKWDGICQDFRSFCALVECALGACVLACICLIAATCIDAYFIHRRKSQID